jgi:hypothetical protein
MVSLKDFCADKPLQCSLATPLPSVITRGSPHDKTTGTRGVTTLDFEMTSVVDRGHLSINGVRAKSIDYFQEKSLDFLIQRL